MYLTLVGENGWMFREDVPCFGMLSDLDCVVENEDWEDVPLDNISSSNLESVIYYPSDRFSSEKYIFKQVRGDMDSEEFLKQLTDKVLKNPMSNGMFDHITFGEYVVPDYEEEEYHIDNESAMMKVYGFEIKTKGLNMQKTLLPAMMIRNILNDTDIGRVFKMLTDEGFDWHFSFMISQMFYMCTDYSGNTYLNIVDYDSTILPHYDATLEDFKNMCTGDFKQIYQGDWGDTENGYGRFGHYDGGDAGQFDRNKESLTLTHTFLSDEMNGDLLIPNEISSKQITIEIFLDLAKTIYEEYKKWNIA
ncbi:hypothetical protein HWB19_gp021 [Cronobacter phage vB_CsaP_009]|uniref:Uncharacterized protein n=1 Tax=Cronobacter phage vB_CsaP_009 TaxID=2699738 RepID=A0A679FNL9_9CAUD|nr:hypothetical protein HWB19_gp021 [Cronobacter phage vB_CsaP_009]BBU72667.1 hypothetical protein [Cronobacter phage vB_CsaP_009]